MTVNPDKRLPSQSSAKGRDLDNSSPQVARTHDRTHDVVICAYARTPIGSFRGTLASVSATDLGAAAISALLARSSLRAECIEEVIMGCVLSAGLGQAPARQAALKGGLEVGTPALTINKMCGSGLYAVMLACDRLRLGEVRAVVAGGMESMSGAPHLLEGTREGLRPGSAFLRDHMFVDGLEDAYEGRLMGVYAEKCASQFGFGRKVQDEYALRSLQRALASQKNGGYEREIGPLLLEMTGTSSPGGGQANAGSSPTDKSLPTQENSQWVMKDEQPGKINVSKIDLLQPAFQPGGTVTAANSSSISDGAAALLVTTRYFAEKNGLPIKARIVGQSVHAQEPQLFPEAPIGALKKLMGTLDWQVKDVGLFEINEAFAVVPLAVMSALSIPPEKLNIKGGSCALGHPLGASGARILCTLLAALEDHGLDKGIAALCLGGGEAVALAVERERPV